MDTLLIRLTLISGKHTRIGETVEGHDKQYYSILSLFLVSMTNHLPTSYEPLHLDDSLISVRANLLKKLPNVLPKGNPNRPLFPYNNHQDICIAPLPVRSLLWILLWAIRRVSLLTSLMWAGLGVSRRILTTANCCK